MKEQVDMVAKESAQQDSAQRKSLISEEDRDRVMELLFDALEGELNRKIEKCIHTPDLLEHIGTERDDDAIIEHFKCQCGKEITEVFANSVKRQSR